MSLKITEVENGFNITVREFQKAQKVYVAIDLAEVAQFIFTFYENKKLDKGEQ
jgi:hypothetical protein